MSVRGLAIKNVNVYRAIHTQDIYAANKEEYYLIYKDIPVRTRWLRDEETLIDGKINVVPKFRIYFPWQLDIIITDLVVESVSGKKYDVLYVNKLDRRHHVQVDTKRIDGIVNLITYQSSSSTSSSSIDSSSSSSSESSSTSFWQSQSSSSSSSEI